MPYPFKLAMFDMHGEVHVLVCILMEKWYTMMDAFILQNCQTALMKASQKGHIKCVQQLLQHRAEVNTRSRVSTEIDL